MTNPTTPFNWQMPTASDLVTDLPADFETFGQAVATSMADLLGGTTGQILSKASNTDMDFTWVTNDVGDITAVTAGTGISGGGTSGAVTITNSMATSIDAKGDLVAGTGSDAFSRLAVGANGTVLTADSAAATGLKWATPSGALTKITSSTPFSGSATVSINDCFSSTYTNYLILFENMATSTGGDQIQMRFRVSGADNSTANYSWGNQPVNYTSGGTSAEKAVGATALRVVGNVSTTVNKGTMVMYLNNPQTSVATTWQGSGNNDDASYRIGGQFTATTSFTGMTIFSTNNISGNLTIYGYEK